MLFRSANKSSSPEEKKSCIHYSTNPAGLVRGIDLMLNLCLRYNYMILLGLQLFVGFAIGSAILGAIIAGVAYLYNNWD